MAPVKQIHDADLSYDSYDETIAAMAAAWDCGSTGFSGWQAGHYCMDCGDGNSDVVAEEHGERKHPEGGDEQTQGFLCTLCSRAWP